MQAIINDALTVLIVCLVIGVAAIALVVLRPWKRRRRHRRGQSHRPKIDLCRPEPEKVPRSDA
jgi:hypothetical protein